MTLTPTATEQTRYRAITPQNVERLPQWNRLEPELQEAVGIVSQVLPFWVNEYVLDELIDWSKVPDDPMFQLTFPQRGMISAGEFDAVRKVLADRAPKEKLQEIVHEIRLGLNPHPAGQMTHNVPEIDGRKLPGLQHKYRETVLFFPSQGQTCHAHCTYCFRWAQFVNMPDMKFEARETNDLVAYLKGHHEVSDVLFTGGDPMIMKTKILRQHIEPLLDPALEHVRTIRIGTKALAYWPQRFLTDDDADEVLRLFDEIVAAGKHLAIMAHYSHPVELHTEKNVEAVRRLRATGAQLRMQAPLVRRVNDDAEAWATMWRDGVRLGMVPYYMFVARDTGARNYFEVPLVRAHEIFWDAFSRVSGLPRTVRGPSMSATPGKVRVLGTAETKGEKVLVLDFLQGRDPAWVGRPFFARFDPKASWLDQLEPAFGEKQFFFETGGYEWRGNRSETE
jgi:KamA family protein